MEKKFSIVKVIDLEKLNNEICLYESKTGNTDTYIFMNYDTINSIKEQTIHGIEDYYNYNFYLQKHCGLIGRYQGYKVFIDDTLSFGEVEIR